MTDFLRSFLILVGTATLLGLFFAGIILIPYEIKYYVEKLRYSYKQKHRFDKKPIEELVKDFIVIPVETSVADVEPVRRGKWIINSDGYYPQCSECMKEPQGRVMTDWCPNCGAKMRGEENNV